MSELKLKHLKTLFSKQGLQSKEDRSDADVKAEDAESSATGQNKTET